MEVLHSEITWQHSIVSAEVSLLWLLWDQPLNHNQFKKKLGIIWLTGKSTTQPQAIRKQIRNAFGW